MKNRLANLPVPILPTMVGACTLSNVFQSLGYTGVRHITMIAASVILLVYLGKIIVHFDTFRKEYRTTVPSSLYAGFTMVLMILGSYYFDMNAMIGKAMWFTGIILHTIHILLFTIRNLRNFQWDTFVPSWFVTYNGIMVSTVVGGVMKEPLIAKIVVYYGIAVFTLIIPFMIYRLIKFPIKDAMFHTQAIVLAPSSLCVVSYLNVVETPNPLILYYLYAAVLCALLFIIIKLPSFFSFPFAPGYAGLTFPMAIGIVATTKFSAYLVGEGRSEAAVMLKELSGIQLYLTTGIIAYVLIQFVIMLKKSLAVS